MLIISNIRKIAELKKDSIALQYENTQMTYEELMQKVEAFAAALRNKGIGSGDRVAIVLARSFELIVAIMRVMTAKATFVPIDPNNPQSLSQALFTYIAKEVGQQNMERSNLSCPVKWRSSTGSYFQHKMH